LELQSTDVAGLVVTLTDHPSELSGVVRDEKGALDSTALVLMFPKDAAAWTNYGASPRRLRSSRTTENGAFKISGPPPGNYFVVAVPEEAALNWQDPKFLQAISSGASSVAIAEGEMKALELKSAKVK
jgi:hypothetical protein